MANLYEAAKIMDDLYWEVAIGNKNEFLSNIKDSLIKLYAMINYGPWDHLDNNKPFIEGYGERPPGANFYPKDMTKEEFEKLKDNLKTSPYTIIRRNNDGSLRVIWFHDAFNEQLTKAANYIKKAAELTEDKNFKKYLNLRAEALITDNYKLSDIAWMDSKTSNIEFIVGPIENYTDELFGYKTAYEAFILIKDNEWSNKLAKYNKLLPTLQKELPVDEKYKKEKPGSDSDINVYDAIYYAGDCNAGTKTIAINLPNDEEIQLQKGTRKLQLKNTMKAKFDNILVPIANILIAPEQRKYIKFNAFFENTMFHEVAHGMGIKNTINGKGTVREALQAEYSAIEEGKADILGLYLITKLYEMKELSEGELMDNYVTFVAGIFRSVRFGTASAHGKANMIRFNYFIEKNAIERHPQGYYSINFSKMKEAVIYSVQMILKIQGDGDKETAEKIIKENGIIKPPLENDLKLIDNAKIPVDVIFEQGIYLWQIN
ncbi:MAG TPA: Zn-dependent hydrolase [Bacteroidales bacterium]|nr:Zn-dependent hydrolase [Bacteroidales bacterium]